MLSIRVQTHPTPDGPGLKTSVNNGKAIAGTLAVNLVASSAEKQWYLYPYRDEMFNKGGCTIFGRFVFL